MTCETVIDLFREREAERPRADMFGVKRGGRWIDISSEEFGRQVRALSQGLVALGVTPGDRVALLSETRYEWTAADHAILCAGAVTVPIYPTLLSDQIAYILQDSGSRVIFCSTSEQVDKIVPLLEQGLIEHVICFEPVQRAETLTLPKVEALGAVRQQEDARDFDRRSGAVKKEDLATLIYTSGTTGTPKGVMLTHDNLTRNVLDTLEVLGVVPSDVALGFLPLSHVLERLGEYFIQFAGAKICYAESVELVPQNLRETSPTILVSVPRLYEKVYARAQGAAEQAGGLKRSLFRKAEDVGRRWARLHSRGEPVPLALRLRYAFFDRLVFSKIRAATGGKLRYVISGGAPLSADIAEFFYAAGIPILEGYGLTETSPVITVNPPEAIRFGAVGRPIPNVEVKIAEDGEILTRSRAVMKGYYNKPAETAEALAGGWFHTGDIGHLDDDGFLYITDRKKDLIVTAGGKNFAPQPVEARIKLDPLVGEVALIGDKKKFIAALIVPSFDDLQHFAKTNGIEAAGRTELLLHPAVLDAYQAVIDGVNASLPRHEQVKKFLLVETEFSIDGGELTPTLKVKRRVVQQKYSQRIDALYGEA